MTFNRMDMRRIIQDNTHFLLFLYCIVMSLAPPPSLPKTDNSSMYNRICKEYGVNYKNHSCEERIDIDELNKLFASTLERHVVIGLYSFFIMKFLVFLWFHGFNLHLFKSLYRTLSHNQIKRRQCSAIHRFRIPWSSSEFCTTTQHSKSFHHRLKVSWDDLCWPSLA
jgi:hypothetical protein